MKQKKNYYLFIFLSCFVPLFLFAYNAHQWMEKMDSPEVIEWLDGQNDLTDKFLHTSKYYTSIKGRVEELTRFDEVSYFVKRGEVSYSLYREGGKSQPILMKNGAPLFDPNTLSEDGTVCITGHEVNKKGTMLAIGISEGGSDKQTWQVMDLKTENFLSDALIGLKFDAPNWTNDGAGLFYVRFLSEKEHALFYHQLGTPQDEDRMLYSPEQETWLIWITHILENDDLLITIGETKDKTTGYLLLDKSNDTITTLIPPGESIYEYAGEKEGEIFLIKEGEELLAVNLASPKEKRSVIDKPRGIITDAQVIGENIVLNSIFKASSCLTLYSLSGKKICDIPLPGIGRAELCKNKDELHYMYVDFATPPTLIHFDLGKLENTTVFAPQVAWKREDYVTTQKKCISKDGTKVPLFITHKKGMQIDGNCSTLLYGYGGFNVPLLPHFSSLSMAFLDAGGIYVSVNLRGGGEFGKEWYEAGRREKKQNVFDDFIAAAEWLIANSYTSPEKLAINGRSNGGLLVGAVLVQRPDLFGAAVPQVGVLDMLNFHRFTAGWIWKCDYGDPEDPNDLAVLKSYSPYHNIQPDVSYPATLITTSDYDDRVVPMHSYKFAAALQEAQAGKNPILLRVYRKTGHGMGRSKKQLNEEVADILTFLQLVLY